MKAARTNMRLPRVTPQTGVISAPPETLGRHDRQVVKRKPALTEEEALDKECRQENIAAVLFFILFIGVLYVVL